MKKTSREMYYRHRYETANSFTEKNIVIGQAEIFMLEQKKALFESGTATIMVDGIPCEFCKPDGSKYKKKELKLKAFELGLRVQTYKRLVDSRRESDIEAINNILTFADIFRNHAFGS